MVYSLKERAVFLVGGVVVAQAVFLGKYWFKRVFRAPKRTEIKCVRYSNKICKGHVFAKIICSEDIREVDPIFECSYSIIIWLVDFFNSATETLDIAIYLVTCEAIRDAIMDAHNRGVKVRICTDFIMAKGSGSAIGMFIKHGIPVSMTELSRMMHRKSAVADKSRVLMGTGNWTMQALAGNWDIWVQRSDSEAVRIFIEEFEYQWAEDTAVIPTYDQFERMKLDKKPGNLENPENTEVREGEKGEGDKKVTSTNATTLKKIM